MKFADLRDRAKAQADAILNDYMAGAPHTAEDEPQSPRVLKRNQEYIARYCAMHDVEVAAGVLADHTETIQLLFPGYTTHLEEG